MIGRGIASGLTLFGLAALLAYATPLRLPVLRVAGQSYAALQYRLDAQRLALDTLQAKASNGPLAPTEENRLRQTRRDFAETQKQLGQWRRGHARASLGGLVAWALDLFPWLAAFGLALPVLGGVVGAQLVRTRAAGAAPHAGPGPAVEPRAETRPPVAPVTPAHPPRSPLAPAARPAPPPSPAAPARPTGVPAAPAAATPGIVQPDLGRVGKPVFRDDPAELSRHPALEASRRPVPPPPAPPPPVAGDAPPAAPPAEDWGFRHSPTPLEPRPRPKGPQVRSPHSLGGDAPADA